MTQPLEVQDLRSKDEVLHITCSVRFGAAPAEGVEKAEA